MRYRYYQDGESKPCERRKRRITGKDIFHWRMSNKNETLLFRKSDNYCCRHYHTARDLPLDEDLHNIFLPPPPLPKKKCLHHLFTTNIYLKRRPVYFLETPRWAWKYPFESFLSFILCRRVLFAFVSTQIFRSSPVLFWSRSFASSITLLVTLHSFFLLLTFL